MPTWEKGEEVATRKAYGVALAALGARRDDIVALDGEVGNSTYSEDFKKALPDRYVEVYIAEQQLVAAAVGFQVRRHWTPFASTFAAFLARAYDFVRMAAISRADIRLVGSHAGVSIGEDGPVADGARGPRQPAGGPRLDRPLPQRRDLDRGPGRADGRHRRDLLHAHHPRRHARSSTTPTRSSRSAARRPCSTGPT